MNRIVALLPIALLLAAGGADRLTGKKYVVPPGATATAKFLKGNLRLSMMRGDSQYYGMMKGDTCRSTERLISYSGGIGGNTTEKLVPIEAGGKVRILGSLTKQSYGGYQYETFYTCTSVVEFTPVAGKTYLITEKSDDAKVGFACQITVNEDGSGAVPDDLQTVPYPVCR